MTLLECAIDKCKAMPTRKLEVKLTQDVLQLGDVDLVLRDKLVKWVDLLVCAGHAEQLERAGS